MIRSGTSRVDITPPAGLDLSGWAFGPSVGIHDRLSAKALHLRDDDDNVFLLITADLIGLGTSTSDRVRKELCTELGAEESNIMISCSHTHSGPGTMKLRRWGTVDAGYLEDVAGKLISVGLNAARNAETGAEIGFGSVKASGIGVNRRGDAGDVVDDDLGIIRIERSEHDALIWNFSCHPVAAHNYKNLVSADYPGYASRYLEDRLGPDAMALFTLGAAGDINPTVFHHMRHARRYGRRLGREALRLMPSIDLSNRLEIASASRTVKLPVQDLPGEEYLETEIEKLSKISERLKAEKAPKEKIDNTLIEIEWAVEALAVVRGEMGAPAQYLEMELQAVRLNNAVVLALPVELFVQIGLNIKGKSPFEHTFIVELANGSLCYLPTSDAYNRGGYETEFSAKVYGLYFLDRRAQPLVEKAAVELLNELG